MTTYTNVYPDGDGWKYRVMIARTFLEKGGFPSAESAAWECDKVKLWGEDLCGRRLPYNFPERIARITESELMDQPIYVSTFLNRLREEKDLMPQFPSVEEVQQIKSKSLGLVDPETRAAQKAALEELETFHQAFIKRARSLKLPAKRAEALLKGLNAVQGELLVILNELG